MINRVGIKKSLTRYYYSENKVAEYKSSLFSFKLN